MNGSSRRVLAALLIFTIVLQSVAPITLFAQDSTNQKAQIQEAVAEFQKTYDEIMAIEEIQLDSITSEILRMIWNMENYTPIPKDDKGITTPDQAAAYAAKMQAAQEKAKLEGYIAQIDKANADIRQLKQDAQKTMDDLKNGALEKAAETDPTQVYNSLDKNASALAIYQNVLTRAGNSLLSAAETLGTAAGVLDGVAALCTALCGTVALIPIAAPLAAIISPIAGMCTAAAAVITGAGNTLISAAENAITSDEDFLSVYANENAKVGIDKLIDYGVGKGVGKVSAIIGENFATTLSVWGDQDVIEKVAEKSLGVLVRPTTDGIKATIDGNVDSANENIKKKAETDEIRPPAFLTPKLDWDE